MASPLIQVAPEPACHLPECVRELRNYARAAHIWEKYLNRDAAIGAFLPKSDSAFWEMVTEDGTPGGLYYGTGIISGIRATSNIVIWNRAFFRKTEMHRQFLRYTFLVYDLQRVQTTCFVDNILSQRFQERLGFFRECVMKNYGYRDGVTTDAVQYAITRDELF